MVPATRISMQNTSTHYGTGPQSKSLRQVPATSPLVCADLKSLSNGPCKKDDSTRQGMQRGANCCLILLLLYRTSDWLNQQNLPKLQVAVYLFNLNLSTIFLSTKSLPRLNATVSYVGNIGKSEAFIVFVYDCCDWLKCFHTRRLLFKIEFKYILFHIKPAFHRLINYLSKNTTFLSGSLLKDVRAKIFQSIEFFYIFTAGR